MAEKTKASALRIIQSDYLAIIGILFPVVMFILYLVVVYFGFFPGFRGRDPIQGVEGAPALLYAGIAGLILGLPLAYWRVRTIQQLFEKSVEVLGQITNIYFHRDRGRVEYSYTYQEKRYSGGSAIMKTGRTQNLRSGSQVVLLVNLENPKQALIRDLYI
jgi:hypothetical protein